MATKLRANQINIQDVMTDAAAQATELRKGTLRIATQAEVNGGSPYDNTIAITPATLAGATFNTNWLIANNNNDFGLVPISTGTNSIALGYNARTATHNEALAIGYQASSNGTRGITLGWTSSSTQDSISIGGSIQGNHTRDILIGSNIISTQIHQISIGAYHKSAYGPTSDVPYSTKIGYSHPANKNVIHQFSKGRLELLGDEAQFIFPNYEPAGSPATLPLPATTNVGGTVYSINDGTLKFYNGAAWTALAVETNWLHANNGSDFGTTPAGTGTDSIALGNNASTAAVANAIAIGTNVTAAINSVSIGPNSDALGTSSVAIGNNAQATADGTGISVGLNSSAAGAGSIVVGRDSSTAGGQSIAIGYDSDTLLTNQIAIGYLCKDTSVDVDTTYSVKIGEGADTANKNMLHLFSQGKLELYGEAAQFIMPNYAWGSPAVEPATATEGGVVYDSTAQELKLYNGVSWASVGGTAGSGVGSPAIDVIVDQYNNIVGGSGAGDSVTATETDNIFLGRNSGTTLNGGRENIFIGYNAGHDALNGSYNIAMGRYAGYNLSNGQINIGIGAFALGYSSAGVSGNYNIAIGQKALADVTNGAYNTVIGSSAGANISSGVYNICLGYDSGPTTNVSNQLFIDKGVTDSPLIHGDMGTARIVTINDNLSVVGEINVTQVTETTGTAYATTGAVTIDVSTGTYFYPTGATTGAITFTFSNPAVGSPTSLVSSFTLELWGDAGSPTPYIWPSSVKWPAGVEPTWTAAAGSPLVNGYDVVSFVTRDGGTTWLGMLGGLGFA